MFVFAEAMAYGTILLVGLSATLLLAVLAMLLRHRGLGLTALLSAVFTIVLIAWVKVEAAASARDHPSPTPAPTVITTWTGSGELDLSAAAFEPAAGQAECSRTTGPFTVRGVAIDGVGRIHESPVRVSFSKMDDGYLFVFAEAGSASGSDPMAHWSGLGELAQGSWLAGRVTFTRLELDDYRGAWPGSVRGAVSWKCDPATAAE